MGTGFVVASLLIVAIAVGIYNIVWIAKVLKMENEVKGVVYAHYIEEQNTHSLFLECNVPVEEIASGEYVTFKVEVV